MNKLFVLPVLWTNHSSANRQLFIEEYSFGLVRIKSLKEQQILAPKEPGSHQLKNSNYRPFRDLTEHVEDRHLQPGLRTLINRMVSPITHSEDREPARRLAGGNTIDLLKGICEYSYKVYLVQKETKVFN